MRISTCLFGCVLLAFCMIEDTEAVACTSLDPLTPDPCTDCTDEANAENDDCTTVAPSTTVAPTTATTVSSTVAKKVNRKHFRLSNVRFRVNRTITIKRNGKNVNTLAKKKKANNARVVAVVVG